MELAPATSAQSELILSLFQSSPSYFQNVEGAEASLATVEEALRARPKQTVPEYKKEFLIVSDDDGRPVGTVELHVHHPEKGIAYIGLLQIRDELAGRGVGRRAYAAVEDYARSKFGVDRIRLGVADDNDVSGFWAKLGFRANGRTYTWMGERKSNNVVEYEKRL